MAQAPLAVGVRLMGFDLHFVLEHQPLRRQQQSSEQPDTEGAAGTSFHVTFIPADSSRSNHGNRHQFGNGNGGRLSSRGINQ